MKRKFVRFLAPLCLIGFVGCSKAATAPVSPSAAGQTTSDATANPDGSTVKASAPKPLAPPNGQKLDLASTDGVTLTVENAVSKFNVGMPVSYRFQLFNAGNQMIEQSDNIPGGALQTSYTIKAALDPDQTFRWQARVEVNNGEYLGTWSDRWSFIAPQNEGFIAGNEIYDPLANGKTVGAISGPVTFVPGVGLTLHTQLSFVAYVVPETCRQCEMSMLVTNLRSNTDGDKTKLFAMGQDFSDIVTNERRLTVEKRGDPPGIVAWRFISHGDQVDTEGADRQFVPFSENLTYFWQATWKNNRFNVLIREGGVDGKTIYNLGKNFKGREYDPSPHVAYLGAPVGRSGVDGASVDGVTYRQLWISPRPRPVFANK